MDYTKQGAVLVPRGEPCDCRKLSSYDGHMSVTREDGALVPDKEHQWYIELEATHFMAPFSQLVDGMMEARIEPVRRVQ